MKFVKMVYSPKCLVSFTKEDVEVLLECSRRHYDGRCKAAGQVGGFLYGIKNHVEWGGPEIGGPTEPSPVELTWDKIDILAKITEPVVMHLCSRQAFELHQAFMTLLRQLNEEYVRLNPREE